jgi:hypothetical protein
MNNIQNKWDLRENRRYPNTEVKPSRNVIEQNGPSQNRGINNTKQ